jgi:hypothetical protein
MKRFVPPADPQHIDVARNDHVTTLPEICYDQHDADDGSHNSSDLGGAEGKPLVSLRHTEFSCIQFVNIGGMPTIVRKQRDESMGGRFHQETALVSDLGGEQFESAHRRTPVLGVRGSRFLRDITDLVPLGKF